MISKNITLSSNQEELTKPVYPGLPISVFKSIFHKNSYTFVPLHWHEAFQFCVVQSGTVIFHVPNHQIRLEEGQGIFINCHLLHMAEAADEEKASYICVDIPPEFLATDRKNRIYQRYIVPFLNMNELQTLVFYPENEKEQKILDNIQNIYDVTRKEDTLNEFDVYIYTFYIWKYMIELMNFTGNDYVTGFSENQRLQSIVHYIGLHYAEKLTLDMIARHISLSRSECSRFFKEASGKSLFTYITEYRINMGLKLLLESDASISEIADAVGFSSQSHYTEVFRKYRNITPKKFRELSKPRKN